MLGMKDVYKRQLSYNHCTKAQKLSYELCLPLSNQTYNQVPYMRYWNRNRYSFHTDKPLSLIHIYLSLPAILLPSILLSTKKPENLFALRHLFTHYYVILIFQIDDGRQMVTVTVQPSPASMRTQGGTFVSVSYTHLDVYKRQILTITRVKRSYSPWSSKIYTLRETPHKK